MKKTLCLCLALLLLVGLLPLGVSAEEATLYEGFLYGVPDSWGNLDIDADGRAWNRGPDDAPWEKPEGVIDMNALSEARLVAEDGTEQILTQNNWLITPFVTIKAGDKLYVRVNNGADSESVIDDLYVYASTRDEASYNDYVELAHYEISTDDPENMISLGLADYEDQGVRIALVHRPDPEKEQDRGNKLLVDSVCIAPKPIEESEEKVGALANLFGFQYNTRYPLSPAFSPEIHDYVCYVPQNPIGSFVYAIGVPSTPGSVVSYYYSYVEDGKLCTINVDLPDGGTETYRVTFLKNPNPQVPAKPVLLFAGRRSITVRYQPGVEYSLDGVNWQRGGVFFGLTPETQYKVYARYTARPDSPASEASDSLYAKTRGSMFSGFGR